MIEAKEMDVLKNRSKEVLESIWAKTIPAFSEVWPTPQLEDERWRGFISFGLLCAQAFLNAQGFGDFGPIIEEEGWRMKQLEVLHENCCFSNNGHQQKDGMFEKSHKF